MKELLSAIRRINNAHKKRMAALHRIGIILDRIEKRQHRAAERKAKRKGKR